MGSAELPAAEQGTEKDRAEEGSTRTWMPQGHSNTGKWVRAARGSLQLGQREPREGMKAGGTGQPVGHRGDSSPKEKPDWRLGTGGRSPSAPQETAAQDHALGARKSSEPSGRGGHGVAVPTKGAGRAHHRGPALGPPPPLTLWPLPSFRHHTTTHRDSGGEKASPSPSASASGGRSSEAGRTRVSTERVRERPLAEGGALRDASAHSGNRLKRALHPYSPARPKS